MIEEQLGKLVTDDPSVIETSLEKYGELVYPEQNSVLQRLVSSICQNRFKDLLEYEKTSPT